MSRLVAAKNAIVGRYYGVINADKVVKLYGFTKSGDLKVEVCGIFTPQFSKQEITYATISKRCLLVALGDNIPEFAPIVCNLQAIASADTDARKKIGDIVGDTHDDIAKPERERGKPLAVWKRFL